MAVKTRYVCSACGEKHPQWSGQCSKCKAWNTLDEVIDAGISKGAARQGHRNAGYAGGKGTNAVPLASVTSKEVARFSSGLTEFDRVLGGGFAEGMVILLGGNPGAGKSTLIKILTGGLVQR